MLFTSKYANYLLAVDSAIGGHKTLTFINGYLDTKTAAMKTGMTEKAVIEALKSSPFFGVDFDVVKDD